MYLAKHPLCERCLLKGLTVAANDVHHQLKARLHPGRVLDWSNLEALCVDCHHAEHRAEALERLGHAV